MVTMNGQLIVRTSKLDIKRKIKMAPLSTLPPAIQTWLRTINTVWPKFKLEKDKEYLLANGTVIGPLRYKPEFLIPRWVIPNSTVWWDDYGTYCEDCPRYNIVAEYIRPTPEYEQWKFEDIIVGFRVVCKHTGAELLITGKSPRATNDRICLNGEWRGADHVFRHYTKPDGTPCGRIKQ
jgi:hypothetical protein